MRKSFLLLMVIPFLLFCSCSKKAVVDTIDIVPEPVFMVQKEGSYVISKKTKLCFRNLGQNNETARLINHSLRKLHIRLGISSEVSDNCILFSLNDTTNDAIGEEGYILEVSHDGILVSANTEKGLFYGFQSLVQMLPPDASHVHYSRIQLPLCTIQDYPRFPWRGSHLDVSRHFFSVKDIKRHLDLMAFYKLNKFHWHLTDDHGWRIQIDKYPQLNDIGSWRVDRSDVPWNEGKPASDDESPTYGGFYTKDEVREIVDYAAKLHIEVIPEIEIPGHCSEILAAYPEFACANDDTTYQVQIGPYWPPRAILCAGNDSVLQFLRDVMDEIIPLFPSPIIHIGGDEAVKDNWKRCPKCQARIRQLGLKDEEQLQGWLIRETERYLALQGKRVITWDESLYGGISSQSIVMSWRGAETAHDAILNGNDVIMTPVEFCYLDYYQANPSFQPEAMPHLLPLSKVYQFDPMPKGLSPQQQLHVLGGQANLWTEYINSYDHAQYMLLPRLLAISESLWSPAGSKDWNRFRHKVAVHKVFLREAGFRFCEGSFAPIVSSVDNHDGSFSVSIDCEVEDARIYYSLDNAPTDQSRVLYTAPFVVPAGSVVKAIAYYQGTPREEVYTFPIGTKK